MAKDREIYNIAVVVLGSFNPVIITPSWLASKGFIRETESDTAKVEIIHPDISRFEIEWLHIEITQSRFQFKTRSEAHFGALKDLIISIFTVLKETPLKAFGINHMCHYTLRDNKEYINFGYWLSPVQQLGELLNDPKLQSVQYVETKNNDSSIGTMGLRIYPSELIKDDRSVVFNCNHHFNNPDGTDAKKLISFMNEKWDYSFEKAQKLNDLIWDKARF